MDKLPESTNAASLTSEPEKLLPCPFCGSDELSYGWSEPGYTAECSGIVQCHSCDAYMLGAHEVDAITAWNTRLSSPVSGTDMVMVPREPTEAMLTAGNRDMGLGLQGMRSCWNAMLTAAPASPTPPIPVIAEAGERQERWTPRVGEEVRTTDAIHDNYGEWRGVRLWVAGVQARRGRSERLNVTVTDEWPMGDRADLTDGFYVGGDQPDDLRPVAALSTPAALDNTAAEIETLRKIVQVVADADSEDTVGSLDIDIPNGSYPRQWLRDAARATLTAKTEKAE